MRWGQGVRFVFRVALALGLASTLDLARAAYTLPPPLFRQLGTSDNLYGTPCNTINNGSFSLTATTGNLSDGCAPRYIPNMYCNWTIKLPGNPPPSVTLETTRFALETNYDFVNVTDGYQLLGTFTGNTLPPRVVSTTGELHVRFTSDATTGAGGATTAGLGSTTPRRVSRLTTTLRRAPTAAPAMGSVRALRPRPRRSALATAASATMVISAETALPRGASRRLELPRAEPFPTG